MPWLIAQYRLKRAIPDGLKSSDFDPRASDTIVAENQR